MNLKSVKDSAPRWLKDGSDIATRSYAQLTVHDRPAPDYLIAGTKRGGTTSLFNYLLMHPGVMGLYPQARGKKSTDYFFKELDRGEKWYRSHFQTETYRKLRARELGYRPISGEASPYYLWDPRVAGRIKVVAPDVKSIVLLRNPLERAWSHYQERVQNGVEPLEFVDALRREDERMTSEYAAVNAGEQEYSAAFDFYPYRERGNYLPQLKNWFEKFDRSQVLVMRSEDMYENVQEAFNNVCEFLEIPVFDLPTTRTFNARKKSSSMPAAAESYLSEYFYERNLELFEYLEIEPFWSMD
ncbi:sulfotransferase domain-containing protein [Paeniglutamicibacter gangotriensis]|uniref:sulfotransferase domain-containing protein n=1 Tax=Paeniglutamicibacter gangotriensis TaxID=254787 RepID=UPI0037C59117